MCRGTMETEERRAPVRCRAQGYAPYMALACGKSVISVPLSTAIAATMSGGIAAIAGAVGASATVAIAVPAVAWTVVRFLSRFRIVAAAMHLTRRKL